MAVQFACENCGKKYKVDDKLAGKRVTCKGCGTVISIPGGAPAYAAAAAAPAVRDQDNDDLDFDSLLAREQSAAGAAPPASSSAAGPNAAGSYCPDCGANMLKGTRICVGCGYDVRLGKQIKTQVQAAEPADEPEGRSRPAVRTRSSGETSPGLGGLALILTIIGLSSNLLPLIGYQRKSMMMFGSAAPMVGCCLGVAGAVLYFIAGNPGAAVFAGGGVLAAFAICMAVDPYAKFRAQEAAEAAAASPARDHNFLTDSPAFREMDARAQAMREESARHAEERRVEMEAFQQRQRDEAAARRAQMLGGNGSSTPTYTPPPQRELPSDPVERDLYLLQSGQRSERVTAGEHLLAAPPKDRLDQVAAAFRALVSEQDVALRRLSLQGMKLAASDENVPALISLLGDTNVEIRKAVIAALAKLNDERALEPLLNRIGVDTDETIEAVRPFAGRVEPLLIAKLKDGDNEMKLAAAKGLLVFGSPACLPEVRTAAKDADAAIAAAARLTWKKIAPAELDPFTETMLDLENDRSADAALTRLGAMQPDDKRREAVVAALTPLVQGVRPVDVSRVATALVNWQGKEAIPLLLPLLESAPAERKPSLARALVKTGDPQIATVLAEWVKNNTDRAAAVAMLGEMGPAAEDAVLAMLFLDDADVAPLTLGLLEKIGTAKSLRQLRMFSVKVQNPQLARQAETIIGAIEKRRQIELREQRLHPAPMPATKKAA